MAGGMVYMVSRDPHLCVSRSSVFEEMPNILLVCKDYSQVMGYLGSQIADGVRIVLPIDD